MEQTKTVALDVSVAPDASDNPKDITQVTTLKIRPAYACSLGKCVIYSNGRHQIPIEIEVKVTDKNNRVLKFDHDTWLRLLSLQYAISDTRLTWKGNTGLCYTDKVNDYSTEVHYNMTGRQADGSFIMIMYVYSTSIGTDRIAVRIDTEGADGIHVTTADTGSGDLRMSVSIDAIHYIVYREGDLNIEKATKQGKTQNTLIKTISYPGGECNGWGRKEETKFDCHYDKYYVDVPFGIKNASITAYGSVDGDKRWICAYNSENNNQHMIVAHPFRSQNGVEGSDTFGFHNSACVTKYEGEPFFWEYKIHCDFDLTQTVTYNEYPGKICFTQMAFKTGDVWILDDNQQLDKRPFDFKTYFELFDIYGNYGKFSVEFTEDHAFIKFSNR